MELSRTDVLNVLIGIWAEVLTADNVSRHSDFFMLGGDSVAATVMMVRIEEEWGILLDPIEIFDASVLEDFAEIVARALGSEQQAVVL